MHLSDPAFASLWLRTTCKCQQVYSADEGTNAEYATIKSSYLATIPDNVSFDQAAALPLVSLTAMQASAELKLRCCEQHHGCTPAGPLLQAIIASAHA